MVVAVIAVVAVVVVAAVVIVACYCSLLLLLPVLLLLPLLMFLLLFADAAVGTAAVVITGFCHNYLCSLCYCCGHYCSC